MQTVFVSSLQQMHRLGLFLVRIGISRRLAYFHMATLLGDAVIRSRESSLTSMRGILVAKEAKCWAPRFST